MRGGCLAAEGRKGISEGGELIAGVVRGPCAFVKTCRTLHGEE